jgi:hypothetical protein
MCYIKKGCPLGVAFLLQQKIDVYPAHALMDKENFCN